ncbi:MAG: hypothetical protein B6U97_02795 [Candidatus Altiarchaeales archaeon ex4484_96]|nr:MAG: hypothetical protein B6U97_02795 [Candidatus Altiarchaeales archaeon ex4484_96]
MKLARFEYKGVVYTGGIIDERVVVLDGDIFNPGDETGQSYGVEEVRFLSPIKPPKIICIGFNYRKHSDEMRAIATKNPTLTLKAPSSIIGDYDDILLPGESKQVEHEAELGIVIGNGGYRITNPREHILGYTIINDVTARDLEREMGQWSAAKSFPTFGPTGTCIETKLDPMDLKIRCWVNDRIRQSDSTKHMIYNPLECVVFASRFMRLSRGDLIASGTIPGVGLLAEGDSVKIEVEGIGTLRNNVSSGN